MSDPLYTTRFLATAHRYSPTSEEQNEARASLGTLKTLLPEGIDPEADIDIVYFVGDLAVPGLLNLNDDGVTLADGISVATGFERRQCNIEHNRKQIVGYILRAALSELGSNRILTPEEALAANKPCNIAIVVALWKVANRDLAEFILTSSAPGSPDKDALSLSFEIGFNDYDIVILPIGVDDLSKAVKIIKSPAGSVHDTGAAAHSAVKAFEQYSQLLRVNKGAGKLKTGERVGRILRGALIPLGAGVVTVPAAQVKGIEAITERPDTTWQDDTEADNGYSYSSTQLTLEPEDAQAFLDYGAAIPEGHIYSDDKGKYGRETEPHVTILYGIKDNNHDAVKDTMAGFNPITVRMGKVTTFSNDDRPYDILKVDVHGDQDLQNLYHSIKAGTENHTEWLDYHPHLTVAYLKKGVSHNYINDSRFEGRKLTFSHLTFSPSEGERVHLPLGDSNPTDNPVYTMGTMSVSKAGRVKIPAGLLNKVKDLNYPKADVTLSDGRILKGVTVFSGEELDLDKTLADVEGVVITDMTPCLPPGLDDSPVIHPHIDDKFPTEIPEKRAENAADQERKQTLQNLPYTDAILKHLEAAARILQIIKTESGVSFNAPTTTQASSPMKLEDLSQVQANLAELQAKVKSATKIEEVTEAFASTAKLIEIIMQTSETYAKNARDAEASRATTAAQLAEVTKTLGELKTAQAAAAAQAKFQERMDSFEATFNLDDEVRAFIVEEVKACVDDTAFEKCFAKAKVMLKEKSKADQPKKDQYKKDGNKAGDKRDGKHDIDSEDDDPKDNKTKNVGGKGSDREDDVKTTAEKKKEAKADKEDKDESDPKKEGSGKDGKDKDEGYGAKDDEKDKEDEACMSAKAAAAIATAKANPTDKMDIDPIGDLKTGKSLQDIYRAAFAANTTVGGRTVEELTKSAAKK